MASDDLFGTWLAAVWDKRPALPPGIPGPSRIDGRPPIYIMHRFLASDLALAEAARVLQRDLRDPHVTLRVWQGLLPRDPRGAPRLSYPAPKKPPAVEDLVARVMESEDLSRDRAEAAVDLLELAGELTAAFHWYGVDPDGAT